MCGCLALLQEEMIPPESDIDFLVHFKPGASLFDLSGFHLDIGDLLNCKIGVISDRKIYHAIRDRVLAEAVPL